MKPEDVFALTGASEPRVSPDGSAVAFVVWRVDRGSNSYPSAVWQWRDGSTRRLTTGEKHDASPRFSPDGSRLAFTSSRDDDHAQLYVMPLDGGESQRLTELPESVSSPEWSPDGSRIAFVARVRDVAYDEDDPKRRAPRRVTRLAFKLDDEGWTIDRPEHIFVVPADASGAPVQVTRGDAEDRMPAWSPDGTTIAFSSARHADWDIVEASDIYLVDAAGGEPRALTPTDGHHDAPSWSPDGTAIACRFAADTGNTPRHIQIAVIDVATGARTILTESLDRNCGPYPDIGVPRWDGNDIYFGVEDHGNTHVYRVPSDGSRAPELVVGGERMVTGFDLAAGTLAYTATTATEPAELFVKDAKVSDAGDAFLSAVTPLAPERFTAISKDGSEVDAWIVRPDGFDPSRRYPVILTIHGGPFTQYGNRLFDEVQVYAGAGYVVLFANPRGSSGDTEAWGRAIRGPGNGQGPGWGSVDYEDLMAVVDTALERFPFCEASRLGVIGGSYGGYMTSWMVSHSDRFAAAISERAVNDWTSMWGSSDFGWPFRSEFGADLYEDHEAWRAISPVTHAANIRTPLLIMHSENDLRCPIEQAEQLFTALRLMRREVEMVRFPNEGHELSRSGSPIHRMMRFEIILEWFARYLRPGEAG